MSQPVLVVIDMLNDFFREGVLAERRGELVRSITGLVALFRNHNLPVIWVRQEFAPDLSDAFLVMREHGLAVTIAGTDGCQILPDLDWLPTDRVIVKKRYSAFFGTNLDEILASVQPPFIAIAGVNTHACVRMTAIDAYQRDYHVVIASDCVASYDDDYHSDSMRYLGGRTRIMSTVELSRLLTDSYDRGLGPAGAPTDENTSTSRGVRHAPRTPELVRAFAGQAAHRPPIERVIELPPLSQNRRTE